MVHLARVTTQVLEQRSTLMAQVGQAKALHRELKRSEDFLERTNRAARVGGWEMDLLTNEVRWTRETKQLHGVRSNFTPTLETALSFYREDSRNIIQAAVQRCIDEGTSWEVQLPMTTADGRAIWTRVVGSRQQVDGHPRLVGAIQDITDERAALDALEASETRYRRLFHYSLGLICTHTLDGTLTSVNPAAVQSLGFEESQMIGRSLCDLMPPENAKVSGPIARIQANHTDAGVIELIAADGTRHYWAYHNVLDNEASPPYVLGHAQDVTALRMQEQQLRDMSFKDPLTQCYNRRYLHRLDELIDERWACVMFDLDHFKHINDTQGHRRGDAVLVEFATFLRSPLGKDETVVRLGGDEFMVVLVAPANGRLSELEHWYQDHAALSPSAFSMGAAINTAGEPVADTIQKADSRLYRTRARASGATRAEGLGPPADRHRALLTQVASMHRTVGRAGHQASAIVESASAAGPGRCRCRRPQRCTHCRPGDVPGPRTPPRRAWELRAVRSPRRDGRPHSRNAHPQDASQVQHVLTESGIAALLPQLVGHP